MMYVNIVILHFFQALDQTLLDALQSFSRRRTK